MVAKTKIRKYDRKHSSKLTRSERKHLRDTASDKDRQEIKDAIGKGQVIPFKSGTDVKITKNKVPAGGLTKQQAEGQVLGGIIVAHIGQHDSNLYQDINKLIDANNLEFHSNCYGVVLHARDEEKTRIKNWAEEQITAAKDTLEPAAFRKSKKAAEERMRADINNAAVKFSRIIKVMQVIALRYDPKKPRIVDFTGCANFANMVSVARLAVPSEKTHMGALTKGGFDAWEKKMTRIVDVSNWSDESKDSQAQRERLESFMRDAVLYYIKVASEITGLRPIAEFIPTTKAEKLRKAA